MMSYGGVHLEYFTKVAVCVFLWSLKREKQVTIKYKAVVCDVSSRNEEHILTRAA